MKTSILTIAIIFAAVFATSQSTYAATTKNNEVSTILTNVNNISEIEIHGNVELYVSDGIADQVKVYNNYYSDNAVVQDENGVLRIASYKAEKLKVWVTVSDLQKLSVYDNSDVKSFGKLSAINLDVAQYNNSSAKLDIDSYSASIILNDSAKADLTGNVKEGSLKHVQSSFLNITNLNVTHLVQTNKLTIADSDSITELALI